MAAWKLRRASDPPPQAAPGPEAVAIRELQEVIERQRGELLAACWNAQAPEDREAAAGLKVVADVGGDGRVAGWQVFEFPEPRRPELSQCVGLILSRAAPALRAPGTPVTAVALVHFP